MKGITLHSPPSGAQLLAALSALANPHRLRIVAALRRQGRNYVSELARQVGLSRPLLHLHLAKLAEAGLVTRRHELSDDGKALAFFDLVDFAFELSPDAIVEAVGTLDPQDIA
jgi:DNA-binding transcriptional ArsR family regulator